MPTDQALTDLARNALRLAALVHSIRILSRSPINNHLHSRSSATASGMIAIVVHHASNRCDRTPKHSHTSIAGVSQPLLRARSIKRIIIISA